MLELTRPVAFIDLETTGVNIVNDRIVELAIVKLLTDGTRQVKRKLINPQMSIPKESCDIHGITDEMVKDAPAFKEIANEIKQFIENCDLGGYNSNRFDIPLLMEEFIRAEINIDLTDRKMVDVQHIFYQMEPRTLTAAYKFYCDKDLEGAHGAEADILATVEVLESQVEKYDKLGKSVDSILACIGEDKIVDYARRLVYNDKGEIVFNFGKYKGMSVEKVLDKEPQYFDWMQRSEFPRHTKAKLTEINTKRVLGKNS